MQLRTNGFSLELDEAWQRKIEAAFQEIQRNSQTPQDRDVCRNELCHET